MLREIILILIFVSFNFSFAQTPVLNQGFPKNLDNKRSYSAWNTPVIADLNRDGQKEIIVLTTNRDTMPIAFTNLTVTKSNGESFPNFPKEYNDTIFTVASGDINGDGFLDIVMRSNQKIYAIDRFGNNIPGFPMNYYDGEWNLFKSLSLYDLDNDGKLEIIVSQHNQICVFDNHGQIKSGWPRNFIGYTNLTPGIADLDNDGKGEIVLCTYKYLNNFPYFDSAYVRCYKYNGEYFSNSWPVKLDSNYGFWEGSPSIYVDKINIDSTFIIIPSLKGINTSNSTMRTSITKYGINGNIKNRIYQEMQVYGYGTLAIGDVNHDGTLDFLGAGIGEDNYLFSNQLNLIKGWPHEGDLTFYHTPLIGKVKSGNELQFIYGNYYALVGIGQILGLDKNANNLPWSPLYTTGVVEFAALSDLNNDGSTEIIALCKLRDTTSYLSVYSIPGIPFTPANHPWPMYAHDRYRTNQYGFITPPDETVGIFPISSNVPDKFSLYQNYPNPFNPNTTINFDLTKSDYVSLKVFDISGREVSQLVSENLKAGSYQVPFNAGELSSGVYFYQLRTNASVITKKMSLIK